MGSEKAVGYTIPAPNGSINYTDAIDRMPENDALELSNIVPTGQSARSRYGYELLASTGAAYAVRTLQGLALLSGTDKLIGAANNKLWEFLGGSATDITGSTVPTEDEWNSDTFGNRAYFFNGVDTPQIYDGSTTIDCAFTGVTLANLINISSFKERLYAVEKDSLKVWYGNTQATGTTATALNSFDLRFVMRKGGRLLFAGSWTNQLATTSADLWFACSSEGEIVFYNGSSPADVTTPWGIVARFYIGKPLGYRAFVRVNEDVWILTRQGIVPISALFAVGQAKAARTEVTRKVAPLIRMYAATTPFDHRWHGVHYEAGGLVQITIPAGSGTRILTYSQDANGWTLYDLNDSTHALSIATAGGALYYAGIKSTGKAFTAETGYNDDGDAIVSSGRLAFSFLGSRGQFKKFIDLRPLMRTKRGLAMSLGVDTDFQRSTNLDTVSTAAGTYTPWGSPWGSPWSEGVVYVFDRHATKGQGHSAAIRFRASTDDAPLELFGFEIGFEPGGRV